MWRQAVGVSLLADPKGKGRRRALPHPGAVGIHAVSGSEGDMVFWVPTGQALSPQPWVGEVTSGVWGRGAPAPPPSTPAPAWLQQRNRGAGCERIWQDLKPPTSPTVTSVPSAGPRPASRRRRCGLTPRAWGPRRPLPALPAGQEGGSQRHAVLGRHFLEGASSREGREGLIPSAEGPCSAAPRREAPGGSVPRVLGRRRRRPGPAILKNVDRMSAVAFV